VIKMKNKIITGIAALVILANASCNENTNSPTKLENTVAHSSARVQTESRYAGAVTYKVSPNDSQFLGEVIPGITRYLKPLSEVKYNGVVLSVPFSPTFNNTEIADIFQTKKDNKSVWEFTANGHNIVYCLDEG
jgi:hypothetical protein